MRISRAPFDAQRDLAAVGKYAWSRMSAVVSTAMTLLLMLIVVSQVGAQSEPATITFKLRVDGNVPADTVFRVGQNQAPFLEGGSRPRPYFFCGVEPGPLTLAGPTTCEGGTEYVYNIEFTVGTTLAYSFVRSGPVPGKSEIFLDDEVTLKGDTTINAYYRFPSGGDAQGDEQGEDEMPSQLPATGAGGRQGAYPVDLLRSLQ